MRNKRFWVSLIAGIMAGVMILGLLLQLIPVNTQAATSSEIRDQIEQMEKEQAALQEEMEELERQRSENLTEIKDIVEEKNRVDQQIAVLHEQIQLVNDQIAAYAVLISDKQRELDATQEYLQTLRQQHLERLRAMEENGTLSYWSVLFEANSFMDLLDRLNMIEEIAAADRRRIEEMAEVARQIENGQDELEQEQAALREHRQELAAMQEVLELKKEESAALLASLLAKGEEYDKWIEDSENRIDQMEDELLDMEAEYDQKKFEEWLATSVPPTTAPPPTTRPTTPNPGNTEYSTTIWRSGKAMTANTVDGVTWYTPCDYNRISSTFGMRFHPIDHIWKLHKGVDFAINCTPIYASRPGVVVNNTKIMDSSFGYYVVLDHGDGFRTVYAHMCKRPYVQAGDFVAAGQEIGCVGSTGASTGDHLHFGVRKRDEITGEWEYVNPLLYVI